MDFRNFKTKLMGHLETQGHKQKLAEINEAVNSKTTFQPRNYIVGMNLGRNACKDL